jgi:protein TonB
MAADPTGCPTGSKPRRTLTITQGFALSLMVHAAAVLPFVLHREPTPPEEPSTLVVQLQGMLADSQADQKVMQETKGTPEQAEADAPTPAASPPPDPPPPEVADEEGTQPPPPPPEAVSKPPATEVKVGTDANDVAGVQEQQIAQTIRDRTERDILSEYVKRLSKKVNANLVYPDDGRQAGLRGAPTVSFGLRLDGQIRPETLKIVASSGHPKLDASALQTVRSVAPFDPPPREMTVAIVLGFGPRP